MIDFIFHSFPCKIYNFYAFTVMHPSQKKDIELELELGAKDLREGGWRRFNSRYAMP